MAVSAEFAIREQTFTARLVGVTALLMNNPASMASARDGKPKARKVIPLPADEAASKAYILDGALFVPTVMIFQSMIEAGKLLNDPDNPRRRISYKLAAALFPPPAEGFPLMDAKGTVLTEYAIDVRRAVVQNQGIQRARPRIDPPWQVAVEMAFDSDLLSADALHMVLAVAGKQVGIMDYRPQKRGPYGRFQVEDFES